LESSKGKNVVGCKWVFRIKYDGRGEVNHFKGRLVAQGFSQRRGVDYEEVFWPAVESYESKAGHNVYCTLCNKRKPIKFPTQYHPY